MQVYYTAHGQPWDDHDDHRRAATASSAQTATRPIAALLTDLKQRGLLDDTLVVWGGEFGRTPTPRTRQAKAAATTTTPASRMLAGRRRREGRAWPTARPTSSACDAVENQVHVHDLHATILHLLGLDHEKLTYRYAGRDFRLTDVHGKVVKDILA